MATRSVEGGGFPPMDEAALERYADWLDELEKSDPESYKQVMATMHQQIQAAGMGDGSSGGGAVGPTDSDAALFDRLKRSANGGVLGPDTGAFQPKFPGDKVMEADGIKAKTEGLYIDVQPGFVIKTQDIKANKKVFVNVCFAEAIQTFSEKKQLDEHGNEQEGIHIPLSLGAPHQVTDKKGQQSLAFDVAVNTKVVNDCKQDKTGTFRNFVCELALEYIDQKYQIKLDARYKLPRLTYAGELPPPRHYIRKVQAPIIQEVSQSVSKTSAATARQKVPKREKTATARCEVFEEQLAEDGTGTKRRLCIRTPAVDKGGAALSPEILQRAGDRLVINVLFESEVDSSGIDIDLQPEYLSVKATGHRDLSIFLPYPIKTEPASVTLDQQTNSLAIAAPIDKRWDEQSSDVGSAPWLLAHALDDEQDLNSGTVSGQQNATVSPQQPQSLAEMFHLAMPAQQSEVAGQIRESMAQQATRWDPVDEDEELPEDRFHRKDMMSMHILEQRRLERVQKAKEVDETRKAKRAEVEEKQQKAREAGKTWREMYPNEPETTYVDIENIVHDEQARLAQQRKSQDKAHASEEKFDYIPTDEAKRAAATWAESRKLDEFDLKSAMAFELL